MKGRLPAQPCEWIDRNVPIRFQFEGQAYEGYQGDVLASALWANGVRTMGRSFKYHRARSIYTLAGYDANVIVENGAETNLRGDLLPIEPGMDVRAVNTLGGLGQDRYRYIERFSRFLPVGFYYKAFHTPRRLFRHYEKMMRRAAGLGRVNRSARAPVRPKTYEFCDLLVVGAGPSGLAASVRAAELGLNVLLVDEQPQLGGSLNWQRQEDQDLRLRLVRQLEAAPNVAIRVGAQAAGWYRDQWVAVVDRHGLTKLRTRATLFATGCIEQPAVFRNNDLPGVMLGSAAQRLMRLYGVKPFEKAVVLVAHEDGYQVALDLLDAGTQVVVADMCQTPNDRFVQALRQRGVVIHPSHVVYEAIANDETGDVSGAILCQLGPQGVPLMETAKRIACDGIAISVGWAANADVAAQAGVKFNYHSSVEQLVPGRLPPGVFVAGRINGVSTISDRTADGARAAVEAAHYLGKGVQLPKTPTRAPAVSSHPFPIFDHPKRKNFVDFDEDLQLVDLVHAHAEGYDSVELLKRYTTIGMGPSQGKLSNINGARILAQLNGETLERTGTTTARPFHHPVSIAHLAGRRFSPYRATPMDVWHRQRGAPMVQVGAWRRPEYYPEGNQSSDAIVLNEARNVRKGVGIIDLSTLGKILISGPDAARLLEHVFTGAFQQQRIGRTKYALACDETGFVQEEGIVARLAEDRFYLTASTTGAEAFYRELQRVALVLRAKVWLANATGHWGAMNVAGPSARRVLAQLTDVDVSATALPFGAVRELIMLGKPALVMRSGFVGELSYELHVAAPAALELWQAVLEAGRACGIRPFGIEAQRLLRLEKGHPLVGHDTDALTTPFEARLDWTIDDKKPFFVGKRSLEILARKPRTRVLVGVTFESAPANRLPQECQLVIDKGEIAGRMTSLAQHTTIGYPIGLAFVRPDLAVPGTEIRIRLDRRRFAIGRVAKLPFYDADNERQSL